MVVAFIIMFFMIAIIDIVFGKPLSMLPVLHCMLTSKGSFCKVHAIYCKDFSKVPNGYVKASNNLYVCFPIHSEQMNLLPSLAYTAIILPQSQ